MTHQAAITRNHFSGLQIRSQLRAKSIAIAIAVAWMGAFLILAGCATTGPVDPGHTPGIKPHRKIGKPYLIENRWYYPAVDETYSEIGMASWYGPKFHGRPTANGEMFDMHAMTAAHRTLPMPSIVEVTNLKNNRTVRVRVNDRGPFAKDRIIDLSYAAAKALDFIDAGTTQVKVVYLWEADLELALTRLGDRKGMKRLMADFRGRGRNREARLRDGGRVQVQSSAPDQYARRQLRRRNEDAVAVLISNAVSNQAGAYSSPLQSTPGRNGPEPVPNFTSERVFVREPEFNPGPGNTYHPGVGSNQSQYDTPLAHGFHIQVGAFSDVNRAEQIRLSLSATAPAQLRPINLPAGGVVYRVTVGPFRDGVQARQHLNGLLQAGYSEAWVIEN